MIPNRLSVRTTHIPIPTAKPTAILMYDWLIRIDDEVRLFWRFRKGHKPPLAVLTYALSRYAPIIQFSILVRSIYPMFELVIFRHPVCCIFSEFTDADLDRSTLPLPHLVHGTVVHLEYFRRQVPRRQRNTGSSRTSVDTQSHK